MFECKYCDNKTDIIGHGTGWRLHESGYICPECDKKLFHDKPPENTQKTVKKEADLFQRHYYVLPNGIQAKDVLGFFRCNLAMAMKYIWRAGKKPGNSYKDDLLKARDYLEFELERIKNDKSL